MLVDGQRVSGAGLIAPDSDGSPRDTVGNIVDRTMETVFTIPMTTYEITTNADTRSKTRRTRTWTIEATDPDEACYQARQNHLRIVGWNASIFCSVHGWARDMQSGQWVQK